MPSDKPAAPLRKAPHAHAGECALPDVLLVAQRAMRMPRDVYHLRELGENAAATAAAPRVRVRGGAQRRHVVEDEDRLAGVRGARLGDRRLVALGVQPLREYEESEALERHLVISLVRDAEQLLHLREGEKRVLRVVLGVVHPVVVGPDVQLARRRRGVWIGFAPDSAVMRIAFGVELVGDVAAVDDHLHAMLLEELVRKFHALARLSRLAHVRVRHEPHLEDGLAVVRNGRTRRRCRQSAKEPPSADRRRPLDALLHVLSPAHGAKCACRATPARRGL